MGRLTLKYFMWRYQHQFQLSADRSAQELFGELLPELDASLFLVGVKSPEHDDGLPVCVEPDHCKVQPDAFDTIQTEFQNAVDNDERSSMAYSDPEAAKRVYERLHVQSLARAIEKCCAATPGQEDRSFMASDPMEVGGNAVSCVLSLDRIAYESHMAFLDDVVDRVPVERSLIQAVAKEFLECCRDALREEDAGVNLAVVKASTEELLRRGGQRFMKAVGWRVFGIGGLENVHRLCDAMNAISAMYYERSAAVGRFILVEGSGVEAAGEGIRFVEPVALRDSRRIRKLLEFARGESSLLVAEDGIIGLTNSSSAEAGFSIDIRGHRHWRVLIGERVVCEFKYGTPCLPTARLEEHEFRELCSRVLPSDADATRLWEAARSCMGQPHGTMLVISSRADAEAGRLSRQSTLIEPRRLTGRELVAVSSIDGAILLDQTGTCPAIGVILDGPATEKGDPSRGARYNSAIRYLSAHGDGCLILVLSEDGDVTLLPKLHPRIHRRVVDEAVRKVIDVAGETPFRQRVYAEALNVLDGLRFYLSASQCEQLNQTVQAVEDRLDAEGRTVRISRREFVPFAEMNGSYWRDEGSV